MQVLQPRSDHSPNPLDGQTCASQRKTLTRNWQTVLLDSAIAFLEDLLAPGKRPYNRTTGLEPRSRRGHHFRTLDSSKF